MPQSAERKREYNRERNRQRRGYYARRNVVPAVGVGGEYERGKGGCPSNVVPLVVPSPMAYARWRFHKRLVEKNERLQDQVTAQGQQIRDALRRITQLEADQALHGAQHLVETPDTNPPEV